MTKTTLAKAIKAIRAKQGLSGRQLSRLSGLKPETLSNIEQAKANPRLSTLEAIAFTLGVEVKELFTELKPDLVNKDENL